MRYQLKDYQQDAVRDVLSQLDQAREQFHSKWRTRSSFALSAVTGAGKTVIAATVIEALIHGSTEFDYEPDPGAVVLWVSKDPKLNEQTRQRIIEAADRIPVGDLVPIDKDFPEEKLQKGTVYFINPDKLREGGLLVRKTNNRQFTFWDILDGTIKDASLTLYLILDEAHEGMKPVPKSEVEEQQTLVQRIINGNGASEAVPIVWGISATPERFTTAMARATNRAQFPNIVIEPSRVQASGLLKTSLVVDIPDEKGDFETAWLREAVNEFVRQSQRWAGYSAAEALEEPVVPLLVVQIQNRESNEEPEKARTAEDRTLTTYLQIIRDHFPDFGDDCVAHVLGDREDIEIGDIVIPKIEPQFIQTSTHVRVLIAKDAVSTGWDCPRAEVLYSARHAENPTYITQLLGRMVRTPLARSTGDDLLNSASCYLPYFNRDTARQIAEEIMGKRKTVEAPAISPTIKVIFKPVDLTWNTRLDDETSGAVLKSLTSLPSFSKPASQPKPIKRALDMAANLAVDKLEERPDQTLLESLCEVLDGALVQYAKDVQWHADEIREAEVRRVTAKFGDEAAQEETGRRAADENTVKEALGSARRAFGVKVVTAYQKRRYTKATSADLFADLSAIDAEIAALSRIERNGVAVVVKALEDEANRQTQAWRDKHRADIKLLREERRAVYEEIDAQASEPELTPIEIRPVLRVEGAYRDDDGNLNDLRRYGKHVLADAKGEWPLDPKLNTWEQRVIAQEINRPRVVAWYRNPSDAGRYSLRIPYQADGKFKSLQPDFIFLAQADDGGIRPSIVDPHSSSYPNPLERLVGLAEYAKDHGHLFARIDAIDSIGKEKGVDNLRVLDMTSEKVRAAVLSAKDEGLSVLDLFRGPLANNY